MYNRICLLPATGGGALLAGLFYHRFALAVAGMLLALLVLTIARTLGANAKAPPVQTR